VLLALGDHTFDVSHRAVVMGVVAPGVDAVGGQWRVDDLLRSSDGLLVEGADVLDLGVVGPGPLEGEIGGIGELDDRGALARGAIDAAVTAVEAVCSRFDVPVAVTVGAGPEPGSIDLADLAGAGTGLVRGSPDLAGAAALGLSVVLGSLDDVTAAETAGLGRERIVLDAGLEAEASSTVQGELLRGVDRLVAMGCAVLLDVPPELPAVAAWAFGLGRGCRVLRTADVRAARRTADVLAAILGARSEVRR
jgi:dihydropteroate synthase